MKSYLNGLQTGNRNLAQHSASKLDHLYGRNFYRRYRLGALNGAILSSVANRFATSYPGPVNIAGHIQRVLPKLRRNQPTAGWNSFVPGRYNNARVNALVRNWINSVRTGNANKQARMYRRLGSTGNAVSRRYPVLMQVMSTNATAAQWLRNSGAGRISVPRPNIANHLVQLTGTNARGNGGPRAAQGNGGPRAARGNAAGFTIPNFHAAPRNRATFNRFAQAWLGVNTKNARLLNSLINNAPQGNQAKKTLLKNLMREIDNPYSIAAFNRAPPTRNTLNTFTREWFGQNISGKSYHQIMRVVHPNRHVGANANAQSKATKLAALASTLEGR